MKLFLNNFMPEFLDFFLLKHFISLLVFEVSLQICKNKLSGLVISKKTPVFLLSCFSLELIPVVGDFLLSIILRQCTVHAPDTFCKVQLPLP